MDFGFLSLKIYIAKCLACCFRHNVCSAWFLDIRISTCYNRASISKKLAADINGTGIAICKICRYVAR